MHDELQSLRGEIERLDHGKFAPGQWLSAQGDVTRFEGLFGGGDFAGAIALGGPLTERLRSLVRETAARQAQHQAARQAAQNDLEAADGEIAGFDRAALVEWGEDTAAVDDAYAAVDAARSAFTREDFAAAQERIAAALSSLRALRETASTNRARADQRREIADAIMQALYDQNYDTPQWYYAENDAQGQARVLSDLMVFAKAPGDKGDMRMRIDLDGKVELEVQNIPEGQETLCHDLIRGLQNGLANEVDFQMTDWGRAAGVIDRPVAMPATREAVRERHIEREGH